MIEPSDEMMGLAKLLAALVEHSADWFIARLAQNEVQALLGVVLRLTGWQGTGNVDEQISEVRPHHHPWIHTDEIAHITYLSSDTRSYNGFRIILSSVRYRPQLDHCEIILP
jgi:hypothetical protein